MSPRLFPTGTPFPSQSSSCPPLLLPSSWTNFTIQSLPELKWQAQRGKACPLLKQQEPTVRKLLYSWTLTKARSTKAIKKEKCGLVYPNCCHYPLSHWPAWTASFFWFHTFRRAPERQIRTEGFTSQEPLPAARVSTEWAPEQTSLSMLTVPVWLHSQDGLCAQLTMLSSVTWAWGNTTCIPNTFLSSPSHQHLWPSSNPKDMFLPCTAVPKKAESCFSN